MKNRLTVEEEFTLSTYYVSVEECIKDLLRVKEEALSKYSPDMVASLKVIVSSYQDYGCDYAEFKLVLTSYETEQEEQARKNREITNREYRRQQYEKIKAEFDKENV